MYSIDKNTLKILKYKKYFSKYPKVYKSEILHKDTKVVLNSFGKYFKLYPEFDQVKLSGFWTFFKQDNQHMKDRFNFFEELLNNIMEDASDAEIKNYESRVLEEETASKVLHALQEYEVGGEVDLIPEIYNISMTALKEQNKYGFSEYADLSVDEFLDLNSIENGLTWRLNCLNNMMRPLRRGDHIILGARVDSGKTSFLLDNIVHMAMQLKEGIKVYYFGNEDDTKTLLARSLSLYTDKSYYELSKDKTLITDTLEIIKSKINFVQFHNKSNIDAELELIKGDAGLIVFDMLDHVEFKGSHYSQVEGLEKLYYWARGVASQYAPVISCSQVDVSGEGEMYLNMHQLHYSKTGKQGSADAIIMLGRSHEEHMQNSRGITVPKNKLRVHTSPNSLREEVLFNPLTGRYKEITCE